MYAIRSYYEGQRFAEYDGSITAQAVKRLSAMFFIQPGNTQP